MASAIRYLTKAVLTGDSSALRISGGQTALEALRGHLSGDKGMGEPLVTSFLDGIPGINKSTVSQQLANLKASGDYARIIREVQEVLRGQTLGPRGMVRRLDAVSGRT